MTLPVRETAERHHSRLSSVPPDDALVARTRAGDTAAFETLFHTYYAPLCQLVDSYVRSSGTAEEIVQSLFLRLWEQRATWTVRDTVRVYLYGAARRRALDFLKHERVVQRFERAAAGDLIGRGVSEIDEDERLDAVERSRRLRQAIAGLPEHYRAVLTLRAQHHLTIPAIARILGIPIKTAETRAARAIKAVRDTLFG
ncbi:MAG TPA: sigma-70 family RNA polymerase sigma factor [Gemmatimonadaceae bacterium]|jgi:RNA polymerase sigma-70 factor (ECF subfamily)|nr:sigma-70 family RNA polymerase sigma factor [Gemmatimonadaceae bacterium]